jgi:uncharacterized protein
MIYEWDPAKRHANLDKHGIDFVDADLVFAAALKITIDMQTEGRRCTLC